MEGGITIKNIDTLAPVFEICRDTLSRKINAIRESDKTPYPDSRLEDSYFKLLGVQNMSDIVRKLKLNKTNDFYRLYGHKVEGSNYFENGTGNADGWESPMSNGAAEDWSKGGYKTRKQKTKRRKNLKMKRRKNLRTKRK
jgi:hypothetical protein